MLMCFTKKKSIPTSTGKERLPQVSFLNNTSWNTHAQARWITQHEWAILVCNIQAHSVAGTFNIYTYHNACTACHLGHSPLGTQPLLRDFVLLELANLMHMANSVPGTVPRMLPPVYADASCASWARSREGHCFHKGEHPRIVSVFFCLTAFFRKLHKADSVVPPLLHT